MTYRQWTAAELAALPRRIRATMLNSVSGFKNAVLIGTRSAGGTTNLGLFNSVVHLGADPHLLGFILRPDTVPRHTYSYLQETGQYTMNWITPTQYIQAHQASASYPEGISEFDATGLVPWYAPGFAAPFVRDSPVCLGLQFRESHLIEANATRLIVGEVVQWHLPEGIMEEDGFLELSAVDVLCSLGLDAYYQPHLLERRPYARPEQAPPAGAG